MAPAHGERADALVQLVEEAADVAEEVLADLSITERGLNGDQNTLTH